MAFLSLLVLRPKTMRDLLIFLVVAMAVGFIFLGYVYNERLTAYRDCLVRSQQKATTYPYVVRSETISSVYRTNRCATPQKAGTCTNQALRTDSISCSYKLSPPQYQNKICQQSIGHDYANHYPDQPSVFAIIETVLVCFNDGCASNLAFCHQVSGVHAVEAPASIRGAVVNCVLELVDDQTLSDEGLVIDVVEDIYGSGVSTSTNYSSSILPSAFAMCAIRYELTFPKYIKCTRRY